MFDQESRLGDMELLLSQTGWLSPPGASGCPRIGREVFHPYSDRPEGGIWANCYAYEEAFGENSGLLGRGRGPGNHKVDVISLVPVNKRDDERGGTVDLIAVISRCRRDNYARAASSDVPVYLMWVDSNDGLAGLKRVD